MQYANVHNIFTLHSLEWHIILFGVSIWNILYEEDQKSIKIIKRYIYFEQRNMAKREIIIKCMLYNIETGYNLHNTSAVYCSQQMII